MTRQRINGNAASTLSQRRINSNPTSSQRRVNVGSVSVQQKCSLPSDSLIPDSLIPDSLILNPEGNLGGDSVCCSTLSDLPTSAAKAPPAASRTPRGQRLPQDWALPKAWGDEAMAEFSGWTVEKVRLEAAKFRDHWVAKAGKDAVKMDWNATWRNWCRSDIAHRDDVKPFRNGHHVSGGHNGHGPKTPEQIALRNAEAMRLLGITLPPPKPPLEYVDA